MKISSFSSTHSAIYGVARLYLETNTQYFRVFLLELLLQKELCLEGYSKQLLLLFGPGL